jgi:predicted GNAT family N-acyltransferase
MSTIIIPPADINECHLKQIVNLITDGGEVRTPKDKLREYILRADLIAYDLIDNRVICTATLKNPYRSYMLKVFREAKANTEFIYNRELGYIVTHSDYRGKGYCKNLLKQFFQHISTNLIYASTRKPEMIHILNGFNFYQIGNSYNKDIKLLIYKVKN